MDVERLVPAEELWWYWSVLAATHQSIGNWHCRLIDDGVLAHDEPNGSWARMQRFRGGRAVLWGRDVGSRGDALSHGVDVLDQVPVWAASQPVEHSVQADGVGFVAWFHHGEWDTSTPDFDDGSDLLFQSLTDLDAVAREAARVHPSAATELLPGVIEDASSGVLLADAFRSYLGGAGDAEVGRLMLIDAQQLSDPSANSSLRELVRAEIHGQMQVSTDIPGRSVPDRPTILVLWARVAAPNFPFEHAVLVEHGRLVTAPGNRRLPDKVGGTLGNLLKQLHKDEAGEESGAWLFARVTYDGTRISFERAFDSWPPWFPSGQVSQGPTLEALRWEMDQRSAGWRPAWASLL